jgi:electron transfer flavoprotein alpha subunit
MSERVLVVSSNTGESTGLIETAHAFAGGDGSVALLELTQGGPYPSRVRRIYRVSTPEFDSARGDHISAALVSATRDFEPSVVVSGPAKVAREALARAGAVVRAPSITGVRNPRVTADGVEWSRDLLSGNATSIERVSTRPVFLSLSAVPTTGEGGHDPDPSPEIVPLQVVLPAYPFRRVSVQPKPPGGLNLEAADRIVSIGRGLQKKEDLALIEALAKRWGAAVGCTRPIAAESGWLSDDHWVGLTGHRVRPSLYVAIGISGAAQHLVGMRDSKVVVAINQDANAPIFQQADYQVVGDLYAIVPELTRRLAAGTRAPS